LGILVSFVESVSSRHGSPIGQPAYSEAARLAGFALDCKLNAGNTARTLKSLPQIPKIAGMCVIEILGITRLETALRRK
jgi:hypothetical protein